MPARRAAWIASPFFSVASRTARSASRDITTRPRATASRAVAGLALTSTMRRRPARSTCVRARRLDALAEAAWRAEGLAEPAWRAEALAEAGALALIPVP